MTIALASEWHRLNSLGDVRESDKTQSNARLITNVFNLLK